MVVDPPRVGVDHVDITVDDRHQYALLSGDHW